MKTLEVKKITIEVPSALLKKALASTGKGVTATVRTGLELLAASQAYEELGRLRGKVPFSIAWQQLRQEDRE